MTYSYGMKGTPAVGKGLGGLPKRSSNKRGEITFAVPGTYEWTPPAGITSICVVCVGGAGSSTSEAGGGGLGWKNNIHVNHGQIYTVVVGAAGYPSPTNGGDSYFISLSIVCGGGGLYNGTGGSYVGDGGGNGGDDGGGAGGYSGDGGDGFGAAPDGGGGGGITTYGGAGGVGLFGEGESGAAGTGGSGGENGHAGSNGNYSGMGGQYGGAGNYVSGQQIGGHGAVRIIWGAGRAFPSTDCGQS